MNKIEVVLDILYINLEKSAYDINELNKYKLSRERVKELLIELNLKDFEKLNSIYDFVINTEKSGEFCWTIVGFINILKKDFKREINDYLATLEAIKWSDYNIKND